MATNETTNVEIFVPERRTTTQEEREQQAAARKRKGMKAMLDMQDQLEDMLEECAELGILVAIR